MPWPTLIANTRNASHLQEFTTLPCTSAARCQYRHGHTGQNLDKMTFDNRRGKMKMISKNGKSPGQGLSDLGFDGGPPGVRTLNLRIKSPQLCQLS